ncbi:MAG TPA: LacI family DNA-binding transcriptional regulator [Candidatus Hydrogenedentes bacterium]|nr:LacI family DNA-binding transcriptional regulator [Candidatus Hydrogenedentota bacterium]
MGCTVNDIARAAGVSRSTVLRALSGKPDISTETRDRIRELAATMKYRPNYIARSLTQGKTNLVGVITKPSLYYASHLVIESVEQGLLEGGYSTLLFISGPEREAEEQVVERLLKNRVDGVIAVPGAMTAPATYHELVETGVKLVILDGIIDELPAPQITGDNYKAGRIAAEHLIRLGHRKIAYLGIPTISTVGRDRARGVQEAFSAAGIPFEENFLEVAFNESAAEKRTAEILNAANRPTAILARHDIIARGVLRAIYAAGLKVPDDISVVGSGNILGSDMFRVPLTTINFPAKEMADQCVAKLLRLLAGDSLPSDITMLDVQLVLRASTGPPPKGL